MILRLQLPYFALFSREGIFGRGEVRDAWAKIVIESDFSADAGEFDEYALGTLGETLVAPPEGARPWIYLLERLADRLNHGEVGRMQLHVGALWLALRDAMSAVERHLEGDPPDWVPRRTIGPWDYLR